MGFLAWTPLVRVPAFLLLFCAGYAASQYLPILYRWSDLSHVGHVLGNVGRGEISEVGHPEFAFALACAIVSTAFALAFAMLLLHVVPIRVSLFRACRTLGDTRDPQAFESRFDGVDQRLSKHPLIGHAWQEFAKTCSREATVVRTVRPGMFFNSGVARERLAGLKLMPTLPGYFVGLGLLLTFVGLVIALSKAAGGVSGSPENMT